jgi:type VI secretion system protein ImpE
VETKELIKEGKLGEARANLVSAVKTHPGDTASRTLLFQVLLFSGEWDKAERHLQTLAELDAQMATAIPLYTNLLDCERERAEVVSCRTMPSFLPATPTYFEDYYNACQQLQSNPDGWGKEIFTAMELQLPHVAGTVNGVEFSGMRNTDDVLAFALEVFAHDRYFWVPFEAIREIIVTPPKSLLDLMWIPASITTWGGLSMNGFLPVLYPDSWKHDNEQVRMGRMTDWFAQSGDCVRGAGQQVFVFGDQDISLLELRDIQFKMTTQEHSQPVA